MKTENGKGTRGMRIRIGLLTALVLCLLATAAFAGYGNYGNSYGSMGYTTTTARLIDDLATRSGPSTDYTGAGSYKLKGQTVTVICRSYDRGGVLWVEIEFRHGGGYRRAWTGAKRLNLSSGQIRNLAEWDSFAYHGAGTINNRVSPRFGPGSWFSTYGDRDYHRGDRVTVIDEADGYYEVESYHTDGHILRCWVPSSYVTLDW